MNFLTSISITLQQANAAIGSIDSAYNGIILKGFYLPKRQCSIITTDYLFNVMTNRCFRIKLQDVKLGQVIKKTNTQMLTGSLLQLDVGKPWGFDEEHHPDKTWMINVLFTLNPSHQLFKSSIQDCVSILTEEDLKIIQSFNTSHCKNTQGRFFKRSRTQSIEYKKSLSQMKASNRKNKVKQKKQQIMLLKNQIQELENSEIQEEQQS